MTVKRITRRDFLRVSLVAGAGLSAASTGMLALAQDATQQAVPAKFAEAPMLADMVTAGTLPPVEQRLPKVPFVVGPGTLASAEFVDWQPGKYGGTIHTTNLNGTLQEIGIVLAMSILRAPDQSTTDPLPAIVSDYKVNADYTEFTLTIREGLKWSDGQPVTTNDVKFLWELYGDTRIFPTFPTVVRAQGAADGTPGKLTVTDDYTFSIAFDKPYGAFVAQLASWIPGYTMLFRPAHYLKTLHGDYTPVDKIQPILDKMNGEINKLMTSPAITVRPIGAMLGPHHLNEVFFDDLRVTEADVLGTVDDGWSIVQNVLSFERVGIARYARCERLLHMAPGALGDRWDALPAELRARWARMLVHCRRARLLAYRVVALQASGEVKPTDSAAYRIAVTKLDQDSAEVLMEIVAAIPPDPSAAAETYRLEVEDHWRYSQASTVSSGSIEMQRILLARTLVSTR